MLRICVLIVITFTVALFNVACGQSGERTAQIRGSAERSNVNQNGVAVSDELTLPSTLSFANGHRWLTWSGPNGSCCVILSGEFFDTTSGTSCMSINAVVRAWNDPEGILTSLIVTRSDDASQIGVQGDMYSIAISPASGLRWRDVQTREDVIVDGLLEAIW